MAEAQLAATGFLSKFTVLRGSVRELWIVFGAKLMTYFAYTVMNQTLTLWLSSDLGFNDVNAGYIVMGWSAVMTLITVFVGSFTDAIGLRRTFLLGVCICIVSRAFATSSLSHGLALGCGLFPLAVGEALMGPVMVAAVQRYTTPAQRSISFSIIYATMNMGIWLGNLVFDRVRHDLGEHGSFAVPLLHANLSTYRTLFLVSTLLTVPNLLLIYFFLRPGIGQSGKAARNAPARVSADRLGIARALAISARETARETARIFAGLWRHRGFYNFLAFLSLAALLRLVVTTMYYVYPKFSIRELGPGAPAGHLWGINSLTIIFLVPIVGALTQKFPAYTMVTCGSFVAASSIFVMAMPPAWFQPLADGALGDLIAHRWLGVPGPVNPYYVMISIYVLWWTVGEAIYSPRLYEYAGAIAPKGQEASYMAMSYLPFFVAKVFVGMFSGVLLAAYCPLTGPRHSQTMWLIIALITAVAPIGLVGLRRYIRVHEAGRAT